MNGQRGDIVIEPLTPALADTWLAFFDNDAFSDNPEWSECYCRFYCYADGDPAWERLTKQENRAIAEEEVRTGRMHGYLAMDGPRVAGWCNAGKKTDYVRLSADSRLAGENDAAICSVVCYVVAQAYRRQGIARQLLRRVCLDAAATGFDFVKAYPRTEAATCAEHYHGPPELYLTEGFTLYSQIDGISVVRLPLRQG